MPRHSFIKMSKLTDLKGRIDYVTNPDRQEHLYATYNTTDNQFWNLLAKENQMDFMRSGTKGTCIEAREFIIALPEDFIDYNKQFLLQTVVNFFKKEYGIECFAGLHHNKSMSNLHIHIIFAERNIEKVRQSINAWVCFHYLFEEIIEVAINFLKIIISKFLLPPKSVFHGDIAKFNRMEEQRLGFMRLVKQIQSVNEYEIQPMKARYESLNPIFKAKERKSLEQKLKVAVMHKNSYKLHLWSMFDRSGYQNIRQFMDENNKYSSEVSRYEVYYRLLEEEV